MSRYVDFYLIGELVDSHGNVHYEDLKNLATVDVVEVVRCKDCKYYLHSNEKCELIDTRLHFYETDNTWAEDAFCAWGERREDVRIH